MVAFARPGSDTLVLLPMHQPCVAKVCCCSTNRPVPTEGRGGSADGRISDRDSLFTKEAHLRLCHRANECRLIGICQESTTVSTDLPGIDNRVHIFATDLPFDDVAATGNAGACCATQHWMQPPAVLHSIQLERECLPAAQCCYTATEQFQRRLYIILCSDSSVLLVLGKERCN